MQQTQKLCSVLFKASLPLTLNHLSLGWRVLATSVWKKQKGYSQDWINQRLKSIEIRKFLTDEWEKRGVKEGLEFAILTDEITQAWTGLTTKQYKSLKGLKKENLRDNMTNLELVLNMLAETATTAISQKEQPDTFSKNKSVAKRGGGVAGVARQKVEKEIGKSVLSKKNYLKTTENIKLTQQP